MRALLDTSILFPALDGNHPKHAKYRSLLVNLTRQKSVVICTHLLAEMFRNLSGQPRYPISTEKVRQTLHLLSRKYECVELTTHDYLAAVDSCNELNLRGSVIYDALHFQAAIKADVDILYTDNLRDFRRLLSEEITFEVKSPD